MALVKWTLGLVAGALLAGLVGGWFLRPDPPKPAPSVPERVVIEKPVPVQTIVERVVERRVPVEVTRTVTEIDTVLVREFVEAAQDSTADPIHLEYSFDYDGEKLLLWGTMSNGARTFNQYDARPRFRGGWVADSTWLREDRMARFPTKPVIIGGGLVVAGVVCLLVCR